MKIFIASICITFLFSQDIAGEYRLSTLEYLHITNIASSDIVLIGNDIHGLEISFPLDSLSEWETIDYNEQGPYSQDELNMVGYFLNINFNADNTGDLFTFPGMFSYQECHMGYVLPITEDFTFTSDLTTGIFSIMGSSLFGNIPDSTTFIDITGDGIPDSSAYVAAFVSQPDCDSLTIEVHTAYGDVSHIGNDPDDLSDRYVIPFMPVTIPTEDCGLTYPVFGDVTELLPSECIGEVSVGNQFYIMASDYLQWGYFYTYNTFMYNLTGNAEFLIDDSDHDFNEIDGRLIFNFEPQCIPQIKVWEYLLTFETIDQCPTAGDVDSDCNIDISDVIIIVNCILENTGDSQCDCGDLNNDGLLDILDVVELVGIILGEI